MVYEYIHEHNAPYTRYLRLIWYSELQLTKALLDLTEKYFNIYLSILRI